MELEEIILKYALQNAVDFKGKANPGAVVGKVLSEDPKLKKEMGVLGKKISEIVKRVNSMKLDEQQKQLQKYAEELKKIPKREKKKGLPDLPGAVEGKVVTRMPPEPSKYNHIGHALSFLINYLMAKKYNGKCILRFDDTNPEKESQEFVDSALEDLLNYLELKPDEIVYASDDMKQFYREASRLIDMNKAYVCFCDREEMSDKRRKGIPCNCRSKTQKENRFEWNNMTEGKYKGGQCVLRLKGNMKSKNMVMRDPVLFRINLAEHYRQKKKYCVWPMYDFETVVEEELCGITHVLRSNEFGTMRMELQSTLSELFGYHKVIFWQYGRLNIIGATTQGREIRELIEKKKVMGWDDPSLVTLRALKRRGITKELYPKILNEVGLTASQTRIDWKLISSISRKLLDEKVNRYFFVENPIKIRIKNAPELNIKLKLHPEHPKRGFREMKTHEEFYIAKEDHDKIREGNLYRLMDCLNFSRKKEFVFDSKELEIYKNKGRGVMHWLPASGDLVNTEVLMEDRSIKKGLAEATIKNLKTGELLQFERFGFCRLDDIDKKTNTYKFWFTHK